MTSYEETVENLRQAYKALIKAVDHGGDMAAYTAFQCQCAVKDALELLKAQEPVKPYAQGDGSFACDNCGETVGWEEMNCGGISMVKYKYCPECGKEVKWDAD